MNETIEGKKMSRIMTLQELMIGKLEQEARGKTQWSMNKTCQTA